MTACHHFTYMHYAYIVHVLFLHMDTRRRRRPYGVAAGGRPNVVHDVGQVAPGRLHGNTATQLVHVPSTATASGITTVAQVVQMQVWTLRVTASLAPTRGRERAAQVAGRGGRYARR